MSETSCYVIIYNDDTSSIDKLRPLFTSSDRKHIVLGSCQFENTMFFDNAIVAYIVGAASMDTTSFVEILSANDPDWLFVQNTYTQVGETETICIKKGGKSTTKKTLLKSIRKSSKQLDLYFAAINQEAEHLGELLEDETTDLKMQIYGAPLLFYLMQLEELRLFKLAIKRGADIHSRIDTGRWIEIETKAGCTQFNAVRGMSLLAIAIEMKTKSVVKFLIDSGLDVNVVDENGDAPINIASSDKGKHKFIEPLVNAGADINHEDQGGWTPLFSLIGGYEYNVNKTITLAEKWMTLGADIKHVSESGANALWVAMRREQPIIDFVKSNGVADYSVPKGYYGEKSVIEKLREAIEVNDYKSFSEFLDVNTLDKEQKTKLLHWAAQAGRMEITKLLVERGIPPYLMNSGREELFAFHYAQEMGHKELAAYLKEQMADYYAEREKRIDAARPLYNRLVSVLESIDQQEKSGSTEIQAPGWKDLSGLEDFSDHFFMKKFEGHQLEHWSKHAVSPKKVQVQSKVDDEFNVTFYKPNRFSGEFYVTVRTKDKLEVVDLGSEI